MEASACDVLTLFIHLKSVEHVTARVEYRYTCVGVAPDASKQVKLFFEAVCDTLRGLKILAHDNI